MSLDSGILRDIIYQKLLDSKIIIKSPSVDSDNNVDYDNTEEYDFVIDTTDTQIVTKDSVAQTGMKAIVESIAEGIVSEFADNGILSDISDVDYPDSGISEDTSYSLFKEINTPNWLAVETGITSFTKNGDQSITGTSFQDIVNWDSPILDQLGITFDSNTGSFTLPIGTYEISYQSSVTQDLGSSSNCELQLILNSTVIKGSYQYCEDNSNVCSKVITNVSEESILKFQVSNPDISNLFSLNQMSTVLTIKRLK